MFYRSYVGVLVGENAICFRSTSRFLWRAWAKGCLPVCCRWSSFASPSYAQPCPLGLKLGRKLQQKEMLVSIDRFYLFSACPQKRFTIAMEHDQVGSAWHECKTATVSFDFQFNFQRCMLSPTQWWHRSVIHLFLSLKLTQTFWVVLCLATLAQCRSLQLTRMQGPNWSMADCHELLSKISHVRLSLESKCDCWSITPSTRVDSFLCLCHFGCRKM